MKNKPIFTGLLIAVLTTGFVAGCATAPSAAGGAAPLAAKINALKAGSAKAEGDMVRITGEVYLTAGLTVPEGVTLDLTADKAKLELRDGAKLTVDGTVNASGHSSYNGRGVEGGLCIGDGAAVVINGNGTINLKGKGVLLNILGQGHGIHLTLDGVTLAGIEDNDSPLVLVDRSTEFVMKSGAITGNTNSRDRGSVGGVYVVYGTFIMEGGAITGNTAPSGGGVWLNGRKDNTLFIMKGGTISDNAANSEIQGMGGGVRIGNGTFIMEGGTITGNTATSDGGGVFIFGEGAFIMEGGTISDNTAYHEIKGFPSGGGRGGGVHVVDGTFTMRGGAITGNTAGSYGGGVYVNGSTFIMEGGAIYGNTSLGGYGGGVELVGGGVFIMEGGRIQGGTDSDGFAKNTCGKGLVSEALYVDHSSTAKWGTGGAYTQEGVPQAGGSDMVKSRNNYGQGEVSGTLIAAPGA